jgi:predicted transcriptional regulator
MLHSFFSKETMFQLWNSNKAEDVEIGPLETQLLEMLWDSGESSVGGVVERLNGRLAYTTVMTTLDRLYKKGILKRRKQDRAFLYMHRFTREEWIRRSTHNFVERLISNANGSGDLLVSCLVEAVGKQDQALLDGLEEKIRQKRKELNRKGVRP